MAPSCDSHLRCTLVTTTLEHTSHLFAICEGMPALEDTDRGTKIVRSLKVFRTGTFKDSQGRQRNWTHKDLQEIVENFQKLQTVFPNPPVRADHGSSVDKIKGYVTDVRVEGDFLVNDVEFTEPDGADKYARKTYRNRSIEVGPYETNGATPATVWPAQVGLAFVDISAVEGLGFRRESTQESQVELATFRIRGVETTNADQVQAYIAELEKRPEAGHKFRIAGADTEDFAKVQEHIAAVEGENATLKTFRSEQVTAGRETFVDKLVTDKKVGAPQSDDLKTFAKSLSDDAYDAWAKTFEKAPAMFTSVVGAGNGSTDNQGGADAAAQEIVDLRETVAMHCRSNMAVDKLKATDSYRKLVVLSPADAIA